MSSQRKQSDDLDSPWKEALEHFLESFLALCFPEVHAGIDWSRGYQSLDKEFQQIVRDARVRKRLADKLFKVWRNSGRETWLLVHVEVQGQREKVFPERMYVYSYRIYDRYRHQVASLAVLCDEHPAWRPDHFGYDNWGCKVGIWFSVVKLIDFRGDEAALEHRPIPSQQSSLRSSKSSRPGSAASDALAMETPTDQGALRSRAETRAGAATFSRARLDDGPATGA